MPDSAAPLLLPPDVLRALQAMGCGYWQWDVVRRQLQFAGEFYRPFGIFEQQPDQVHRYWDSLRTDEGAVFDMEPHRNAPPGLRLWCGCTVETADVVAATPWLEWAFEAALQSSPQ